MFAQDNGEPMHPDSVTDWLSKFSKRHGLPHITWMFCHYSAGFTLDTYTHVTTLA